MFPCGVDEDVLKEQKFVRLSVENFCERTNAGEY